MDKVTDYIFMLRFKINFKGKCLILRFHIKARGQVKMRNIEVQV
jgi:hypothetical protein